MDFLIIIMILFCYNKKLQLNQARWRAKDRERCYGASAAAFCPVCIVNVFRTYVPIASKKGKK